jgi:hypothetical protein
MEVDIVNVVDYFLGRRGTLLDVRKKTLLLLLKSFDVESHKKGYEKIRKKDLITNIQNNVNNIGMDMNLYEGKLNNLLIENGILKKKNYVTWFFNRLKKNFLFALNFFVILLHLENKANLISSVKKKLRLNMNSYRTKTPLSSRLSTYKSPIKSYVKALLRTKV